MGVLLWGNGAGPPGEAHPCVAVAEPAVRESSRARGGSMRSLAALLALICAAAPRGAHAGAIEVPPRRMLAVLPMGDLADDVRFALAEAAPFLQVAGEEVERILAGLRCDPACDMEQGRKLDARWVVGGRHEARGLVLRLTDVGTGELLAAATAGGESVDEVKDALPAAVRTLLAGLGDIPITRLPQPAAAPPSDQLALTVALFFGIGRTDAIGNPDIHRNLGPAAEYDALVRIGLVIDPLLQVAFEGRLGLNDFKCCAAMSTERALGLRGQSNVVRSRWIDLYAGLAAGLRKDDPPGTGFGGNCIGLPYGHPAEACNWKPEVRLDAGAELHLSRKVHLAVEPSLPLVGRQNGLAFRAGMVLR